MPPIKPPPHSRLLDMDERRSKNWWKISCVGCVGLPCLSLMLACGWIKCQVGKIGDQLPNELAALKKMGVPVEPEDLSPNPPIPPGQNAKDLLEEIIRDFTEAKKAPGYSGARTALVTRSGQLPEDQPIITETIAKLTPLLAKADRIAKYRRLDFQRDYSLGAELTFPELASLKEIGQWQAVKSRVLVKRQDYAGSLAALRSTFTLAGCAWRSPRSSPLWWGLPSTPSAVSLWKTTWKRSKQTNRLLPRLARCWRRCLGSSTSSGLWRGN